MNNGYIIFQNINEFRLHSQCRTKPPRQLSGGGEEEYQFVVYSRGRRWDICLHRHLPAQQQKQQQSDDMRRLHGMGGGRSVEGVAVEVVFRGFEEVKCVIVRVYGILMGVAATLKLTRMEKLLERLGGRRPAC
ncbi:unnamed protein product [Ceratitis capitata]|uniref:(Mediterranean fruit fly) hypothetical protein n=1 Tax=Ceratitis capitata TaxID=7213 RepID=A0A811V2X2_CERCA|nr:unnamed protein product [Ceratitis capitata]